MWRGGFVVRTLTIGVVVGLCLGMLAWLDSGFWLAAVIVFVVVGTFYGIWMARRMARYWPGAKELTGDVRVRVARAVRRGEAIDDARLAQPVIDYSRGLHAAAEKRMWRWLLIVILAVAVGTAIWDSVAGSWGNTVASVIYLAALLVELFWVPKWQAQLLTNADRAAASAANAAGNAL